MDQNFLLIALLKSITTPRRSLSPYSFEDRWTLGIICNYTLLSFGIWNSISKSSTRFGVGVSVLDFLSPGFTEGYWEVRPLRGHLFGYICLLPTPDKGSNFWIAAGATRGCIDKRQIPDPEGCRTCSLRWVGFLIPFPFYFSEFVIPFSQSLLVQPRSGLASPF